MICREETVTANGAKAGKQAEAGVAAAEAGTMICRKERAGSEAGRGRGALPAKAEGKARAKVRIEGRDRQVFSNRTTLRRCYYA